MSGSNIFDKDNNQAPGQVNKRDPDEDEMDELLDWMGDELGFVTSVLDYDRMDTFSPTGEWQWEQFQLDHLDHAGWWAANKPRQVGISTSFAAKAFARGILTRRNYTAIFVSYKKDEAQNKIQYVRQFLEALPPSFEKEIVRDPLQLIEWENNNGTRSKIISHSQNPIRGINGDVFLDELAFYQHDKEIYESALPAVGGARANLEVTSTPFGADGMFYKIMTDPQKHPEFKRCQLKWWQCQRYLKDQGSQEANIDFQVRAEEQAPKMSLEERVFTFGNDTLQMQYRNADDDQSFKQEFEGHFVDEQAAFFSKNMILNCMYRPDDNFDEFQFEQRDIDQPGLGPDDAVVNVDAPIAKQYQKYDFKRYETLDDLFDAVRRGEVSTNLFAGADIGATRHTTSIMIQEEKRLPDGSTLQIERFSRDETKDWPLPKQEEYFKRMLGTGMVQKLYMDATGVGMQMGQELEEDFGDERVNAIQFGGSSKKLEKLFSNLKNRMENGAMALVNDRRTVDDLYAIKRVITKTGSISFRIEEERKRHHADKAYAVALCSLAGTKWGDDPGAVPGYVADNNQNLEGVRNVVKRSGETSDAAPDRAKLERTLDKAADIVSSGPLEQATFKNHADPGEFNENYDEM